MITIDHLNEDQQAILSLMKATNCKYPVRSTTLFIRNHKNCNDPAILYPIDKLIKYAGVWWEYVIFNCLLNPPPLFIVPGKKLRQVALISTTKRPKTSFTDILKPVCSREYSVSTHCRAKYRQRFSGPANDACCNLELSVLASLARKCHIDEQYRLIRLNRHGKTADYVLFDAAGIVFVIDNNILVTCYKYGDGLHGPPE